MKCKVSFIFRVLLGILLCYPFVSGKSMGLGRDVLPASKRNNNQITCESPSYSAQLDQFISVQLNKQMQNPEDSLTKEELKEFKKEQRAERRAKIREERKANRVVIDNPNHADFIILGEDLPQGRGILQAISGRVPGMMIDGDGYVTTHGPSSFHGGGTPLFLVDGIEVSKEYVNSMNVKDVKRIEIFTGSSSAMYGSRAGNGVISVYTIQSVSNNFED